MDLSLNHSPMNEQIQGSRAASAMDKSAPKKDESVQDNLFVNMMKAVMSKQISGAGTNEISQVYGTLISSEKAQMEQKKAEELSRSGRVKAIKEEYNEEESRNFAWMMTEAKRLKKMLAKFEELLGDKK